MLKKVLNSANIRNSFWNFLDIFLYPILFFSTTSFFIDSLGVAEFGVWMLVNTIMMSMQLFNLGLGTATFKNVAYNLGKGDFKSVAETINTNFSISIIIHSICILVSIIISFGIFRFSFFNLQSEYKLLASYGAVFAGIIVGLKFYEQIISYYFKASEKFYMAMILNTGVKVLILAINIILIFFGFGLITIFYIHITFSLIGIVIGIWLIGKQLVNFQFHFSIRWESVKRELNFAIWTWFQSLFIIITFQLDRFFVVTYFGLTVVAYYGLTATIFNHIHMGFNSIVPWLAPKVTKRISQNIETEDLYFNAQYLCVSIGILALFLFSIINPPILKLILGIDKFNHAQDYIVLFTAFELFFVYSIVPNYYLNAAGHEKFHFILVLGYCSLSIIGMIAGYNLFHSPKGILQGLTLATCISMFLQNYVILKKVFGKNGFFESLILMLPALLCSGFVLSEAWHIRLAFVLLFAISYYFVFIRTKRMNFNFLRVDEFN